MEMSRLKPSGRIGDNMKKTLGLVALFVIIISSCFYFFVRQPKNIFDEIYQETEKTYLGNNVFNKLKDVEVHKYQEYDDDSKFYSYVLYQKQKTPHDYKNIDLIFHFTKDTNTVFVSFEKELSNGLRIFIFGRYLTKEKLFQKNVQLLINQDGTDKSIEDEAQVKSYLEQYGITAKDLDSYYDEIVNQKVLKDWCSIFDSKYSPSNYGDVKIETQWENW